VRSQLGKGSVFAIEVPLAREAPGPAPGLGTEPEPVGLDRHGAILVIEDDPMLREMLELAFAREGHRTMAVPNGPAALALVQTSGFRPDLVVSDYLLPGGMNGLQTAAALRASLASEVPVVFSTGDIATASLRDIALSSSIRLTTPVKPEVLLAAMRRLLPASAPPGKDAAAAPPVRMAAAREETIFVIDDDRGVREALAELLTRAGYRVEAFAGGDAFLAAHPADARGCLVTDVRMPGISGFELLARLAAGR
jgi:two-component system, chemotaxis family, CheB/CheR fusion protein